MDSATAEPTPADAVKALLIRQGKSTAPEPLARVADQMITGAAGPLPARIYWPAGPGPFPILVYYHGGGWVIGSKDVYDSSTRALANLAGAVVISVDYRLGPEHPFPAAHDDAYAAYTWARANAGTVNGDPSRIAVGGESAGGNLAVSTSMMARDRRTPLPVFQMVVYPIAGADMDTASYHQHAMAKPLSKVMMAWFFDHYLPRPADRQDPRINLVAADLKGLPPTRIVTAGIDPLRSEGDALAGRLRDAGVAVETKHFDGVAHEFFGMSAVLPEAKDAQAFVAEGLRGAFARR